MKWGGRQARILRALAAATYGTRCHYCGEQIPPDGSPAARSDPGLRLSAAHLVDRRHGGQDVLSNVRPAHLRCNQRAAHAGRVETGWPFFSQGP